MSRLSLLPLVCLPLVACGADHQARRSTLPEEGSSASITSITLMHLPDSEEMVVGAVGHGIQIFSIEGKLVSPESDLDFAEAAMVDARFEQVWLASEGQLLKVAPPDGLSVLYDMPEGGEISAIEVGHAGTAFVADARANRIYTAAQGTLELLVDSPELGHPTALLLDGGTLLVGGKSGLVSLDIKSGELELLTSSLGKVVALTHDHLGYYVAATASGELHQVKPGGSSAVLHTLSKPTTSLAFHEGSRTLFYPEGHGIVAQDYLQWTGEDATLWAERDKRPMRAFGENGMFLAGGEYWPSHGATHVSYPDDILWGFYPSPNEVTEGTASKVAPPAATVACAEKSYQALQAFFAENRQDFHKAAEKMGASKQFYLWVNDYSDAAKNFPHEIRMNKFWYWERKPAVSGRVPGFWKWETTLLQDGSCQWPQSDQIGAYLAEKLEEVAR